MTHILSAFTIVTVICITSEQQCCSDCIKHDIGSIKTSLKVIQNKVDDLESSMGCKIKPDINYCANKPCGNGGTCMDEVNGYKCLCVAGYTGKDCSININDCANKPCGNGGTCMDEVNGYKCRCAGGFIGTNCSTRAYCDDDGWELYNSHCYLFVATPVNWTEAKTNCESKKAYLMKIEDKAETEWLTAEIKKKRIDTLWIGASIQWAWTDGSAVEVNLTRISFSFSCGIFSSKFISNTTQLGATNCIFRIGYICEKE